MKWRSRRVSIGALIFLACLGLISIALVEFSTIRVKKSHFDAKVEASNLAFKGAQVIRNYELGEQIIIDPVVDPNATGLIGEQFTLITTDRGSLTSKLTTTNPNWAAVVVDMLKEVGVEQGDLVAIGYTGSMPALNLATLCALETIGAKPVIIASVGASMWGANNPEFAWLDMEKKLYDSGIISFKSVASSIGGRGDRGGNVSPQGRELIREIIQRNDVILIEEATLDNSVQRRMEIYNDNLPKGKQYSAYINIGGGLASIGSFQNFVMVKAGITEKLPVGNYPLKGTMIRMAENGTPVINLTDIRLLAKRYGLPVAPEPLPDIPHGEVYFEKRYRMPLVIAVLSIYLILVFVVIRVDLKSFILKKPSHKK